MRKDDIVLLNKLETLQLLNTQQTKNKNIFISHFSVVVLFRRPCVNSPRHKNLTTINSSAKLASQNFDNIVV